MNVIGAPQSVSVKDNSHLSDLFFSYEHPHCDEHQMHNDGDLYPRHVVRNDAVEFATTLKGAFGVIVDPDELVEDFLARL